MQNESTRAMLGENVKRIVTEWIQDDAMWKPFADRILAEMEHTGAQSICITCLNCVSRSAVRRIIYRYFRGFDIQFFYFNNERINVDVLITRYRTPDTQVRTSGVNRPSRAAMLKQGAPEDFWAGDDLDQSTKVCPVCGQRQSVDHFGVRFKNGPDPWECKSNRQSYCKVCNRAYQRRYWANR